MKKIILIGILPIILALGAIAFTARSALNQPIIINSTTEPTPNEENTNNNDTPTDSNVGEYLDYQDMQLIEGKNILFFAASWCPSCRGLDKDIQNNLSQIPSGVRIQKIDYDTSTDLKQRYEVTLQHTLVVVDSEGNLIRKWNGLYKTDTLSKLLEEAM